MIRDDNDSYKEVILETGASIELAPKTTKPDTHLLEHLRGETVKDRESNKFCVSVSNIRELNVSQLFSDYQY